MSQVNSHRHTSLEEILRVLRKDRDERTKEDLKMLRMYLKGYQLFKEMELTLPEQQLTMLLREMKCQVRRKVMQKLNTVEDYQFILKGNNRISTGKSIEFCENDSKLLIIEDGKENNNESMVNSCIVAGQEQNLGKSAIIASCTNKPMLDGEVDENVWMAILSKESMKNVAEKYQKLLCEDQIVFLRQMPFLADWSKILLTNLLSTMKTRIFIKNQHAFKQGDAVQYIYLVKSGEFEVFQEIEADPEEPKLPSDEFIQDLQEVFETYNELNLSVARNRNTSTKKNQRVKSQFKQVAVLSAGESFGLKEIAEELDFRENSVVCSSVTAEVLLLEKKVYFQSIIDKLTYEDLKAESNLRESWRNQRLNSSKGVFENSNLRKFQIQTNNSKNTLPTCLNNAEIKSIIQKQPAIPQSLQTNSNSSNPALVSKSLNVTIMPQQQASKSLKTPMPQKQSEISNNLLQHSLDTIPSDLDNLPKTDRSRKDPQISRCSLSPGLEMEFVEDKTSPNKNELKQAHTLKGMQNSSSNSSLLLRPLDTPENNVFQRRENLAVLNRYNFIKNKNTTSNQQSAVSFSTLHTNKDKQLKEIRKQQLKNSNSIHRSKANSINKQNNIATQQNQENQGDDNSQNDNNATNQRAKDKELKGILTKDDLTIRFQQMVDIEEEMFEAQQQQQQQQQLHSGNVTPSGAGNSTTTPSTRNQTLKCFQKDFQSAENKFHKMTLLESLSQRDQFDRIYTSKKAFADRIVQRVQTARSSDQQRYPKSYFNIFSPRESTDSTPSNVTRQLQFSHVSTPQTTNKKNQFQKKYFLRNPMTKKVEQTEDKKQVFTSATSLRFKTEIEEGAGGVIPQEQSLKSSPNERIITESTNNEERVFNISNENHCISWNDNKLTTTINQGISEQEQFEKRHVANHLTDSVRSLNNLSTSSRLNNNNGSTNNLCNAKSELLNKKNKIDLVFNSTKSSSIPNGKKLKNEENNYSSQRINSSLRNEQRKSYTALHNLDLSDYNFFFSSKEDQYHHPSAAITPSAKGNSNKQIKHFFKQATITDEQKYPKQLQKQSTPVIIQGYQQGEAQQSQQNTPLLSHALSSLQSCSPAEQTPSGTIQTSQQQLSSFNRLLFHSPYQQSPVFSPTQLSSYQSGLESQQRKGSQIPEEKQFTPSQAQEQDQSQKKQTGMRREFLKQLLSRGKDEISQQQKQNYQKKTTQSYQQLGLNSQLLTSSTPRQLVFSYIHSPKNATSKPSFL